ncbi:MAG: phenylacetate--CoA ligase family protein, partial [Pseudonocardia sp.]|nr:phenylacetate--CoA ligase family protein [Pseudonocardia sp.]
MMRTFASPRMPWRFVPVTTPVAEQVAALNEIGPTMLAGYTSALQVLAHEARAGRLRIAPAIVATTSEPLLPEGRALLEETFGATVVNVWATSEGVTAASCGSGDPWLHVADDLAVVEPVDALGRAVEPGVTSDRILVTNLYNHALPLIRYEITDQLTLLDGGCRCGSLHRRITDPLGRLDDVFRYGEVPVHPHVFRSPLSRHPEIVEYQVRQTPRGAAVAVRSARDLDTVAVAGEIRAALAAVGVPDAEVSVHPVDVLPRGSSGKLARFVPLGTG